MALRLLALVIVFLGSLAIPYTVDSLGALEPMIPESEAIELMNIAYHEGHEHGMKLCQPTLPKGPKLPWNKRNKL